MNISIDKKTKSKVNIGKIARSFLNLLHHGLLATHVGLVVRHSIKSGVFGLEFWLTLVVNVLLLLDLERIADTFSDKFSVAS